MRHIQIITPRERQKRGQPWYVRAWGSRSVWFRTKTEAMKYAKAAARDKAAPGNVSMWQAKEKSWAENY